MQLVHAVDTLCFRRQRRNKAEALWTRWAEHSRVGSRTPSRGLQAITNACHPHVCGLSPARTLTSVLYVTRTGNEEYQFGDFTRSAVEGTKVGVEDAVKKVTGNEEYQCDTGLSPQTGSTRSEAAAKPLHTTAKPSTPLWPALRTLVPWCSRAVGDVTKSILAAADQSVNEYVNDIQKRLLGDLTQAQRDALVAVGLKTGAMCVLAYGLVDKLLRAISFVLAWAASISSTHLSPLAPGQWRAFMTTHATIRMVYVPVLFPLHVLATVALALPYRSLILSLQRRLPLQNRPWLNAGLALSIAFALGTGLATGVAALGVRLASLVVGVPVFV